MADTKWQTAEVSSPHIDRPVPIIVARNVPYLANANRMQNLNIYMPATPGTLKLNGSPVESLPARTDFSLPQYYVHIHGGAWRDPKLTSTSIEAAVAHAFSAPGSHIIAIASLNYTITNFPTHPALPYDTIRDNRSDPARDGRHPDHVRDVLRGFSVLRSLGLTDDSYILSGHSCGACLAFQGILQSPQHWGLDLPDAPRPAALLGLNGLYDLPQLVHGLGPSHSRMRDDYQMFLGYAFGADQEKWPAASPALFDCDEMARRVRDGTAPKLVVLDQSTEDQLVPMNQRQRFAVQLEAVAGLTLVIGQRCTGAHAAPWEQGYMIWQSVEDTLRLLKAGE